MDEFHWHLSLKTNFMSNFSSMALDPKHFPPSSIINSLFCFVRVKSFQDNSMVTCRVLCWLSKEVNLNLNLAITCLVDLRHSYCSWPSYCFSHTEELKQAKTPAYRQVLKSWIIMRCIKIEKQVRIMWNLFLYSIWFPPHYHFI